jgi:hypothetical protein
MKLSFQRVEGTKILLLGSNGGTRPGAVGEATLTLMKAGDSRPIPFKGSWHETSASTEKGFEFLGPGKSALFVLDITSETSQSQRDSTITFGEYTCRLEIVTAEFGRKNRTILIDKPCQDLRPVLLDRVPKPSPAP